MCLAQIVWSAEGEGITTAPTAALIQHAGDYTFGYYPHGWRGRDAKGDIAFAVQTNRYAALINASRARIERLGPISRPLPAEQAVIQGNGLLGRLPETTLTFSLAIDGKEYIADAGAPEPQYVLLYRVGKYLQHFTIHDVKFHAADGAQLADIEASLEFWCWSDRLSATLNIERVSKEFTSVTLSAALAIPSVWAEIEPYGEAMQKESGAPNKTGLAIHDSGGCGLALLNPPDALQYFTGKRGKISCSTAQRTLTAGIGPSFSIIIVPAAEKVSQAGMLEKAAIYQPLVGPGTRIIKASAMGPTSGECPVTHDPVRGCYEIELGENSDIWKMERVQLKLSNPEPTTRTLRLNFSKDSRRCGSFGITGMSPVLRDACGYPLGLPVQISKDWHVDAQKPNPLNPSSWFSGLTMLTLGPHAETEIEFDLAYAQWGGAPAVSHAQLSLVGYTDLRLGQISGHQLWDQLAIGSFGESICYDPDINLGRAMVDDMRPLMVWGMGKEPKKKWNWTHNVGGADFLVLYRDGKREYLSRQKTFYASHGPVLSDVTYAGEAADGAIQSRIRTRSWRTDDYVRAFYSMRYDIRKKIDKIDRLAFFQMGADGYDGHQYGELARGTLKGLEEKWAPERGGLEYSRRGMPLMGDVPWFSLHRGIKLTAPEKYYHGDQGAWANRGLIVRAWRARLGGVDRPEPFYSIFGTENGPPSAAVELSPPRGLAELAPGDYVEAQVEMLILPQRAEDYYGPNQALRTALATHPDSWPIVHREAKQNHLEVSSHAGAVESRFPVRVRAEGGRFARFTVKGGAGYVPVTISGAAQNGPFTLKCIDQGGTELIDQSSEVGNDWWQADYNPQSGCWDLTFSLPMDGPDQQLKKRAFEWRLKE